METVNIIIDTIVRIAGLIVLTAIAAHLSENAGYTVCVFVLLLAASINATISFRAGAK